VSRYVEPLVRLIEELKKLPGVGTKSAQRFAFHILRSTDEDSATPVTGGRGIIRVPRGDGTKDLTAFSNVLNF
jgi:recombination protein RecR